MKQILIKFSTKYKCPLWVCDTGECGHSKGPKYCGNKLMEEPSGHCPCEDVPEVENGSGQNSATGQKAKVSLPEGEHNTTKGATTGGYRNE